MPQLTMLNAVYHADCLPVTGLIVTGSFMAFFMFLASQMSSIERLSEDHNMRAHSSCKFISNRSNICITTYHSHRHAEHPTRLWRLISFIKPINPLRTRHGIEVDSKVCTTSGLRKRPWNFWKDYTEYVAYYEANEGIPICCSCHYHDRRSTFYQACK